MGKNCEFYKENGMYCAWIAGETDSGYKITAGTIESLAERVKEYITDCGEELFGN